MVKNLILFSLLIFSGCNTSNSESNNGDDGTISHGYVEGVTPSKDSFFENRTYPTIQADWEGPGGDKLWLGRNLGSTEIPGFYNTSTAEVNGWYFQFNRSFGHYRSEDGTDPNFDHWYDETIEDLTWQKENDPCNLSLRGGWRIPSVDEMEAYINHLEKNEESTIKEAFQSILKLSTTGYFDSCWSGDGCQVTIKNKHAEAGYWTSENNQKIYFNGSKRDAEISSGSYSNEAFPVRCIRD